MSLSAQQPQREVGPRPLFPPEALAQLEGPDRDEWQQPDRIMDVLLIADGAKVADVGAGGGWFTVRLAKRVGPNGVVYAEDIQPRMIEAIQRRPELKGLQNVKPILGTPTDPRLPGALNAVLMVGLFAQVGDPVGLLRQVRVALAPTGRLGIVEFKKVGGGPGPLVEDRVEASVVKTAAARAGLRLISEETFLRYQYLLVFGQ